MAKFEAHPDTNMTFRHEEGIDWFVLERGPDGRFPKEYHNHVAEFRGPEAEQHAKDYADRMNQEFEQGYMPPRKREPVRVGTAQEDDRYDD